MRSETLLKECNHSLEESQKSEPVLSWTWKRGDLEIKEI